MRPGGTGGSRSTGGGDREAKGRRQGARGAPLRDRDGRKAWIPEWWYFDEQREGREFGRYLHRIKIRCYKMDHPYGIQIFLKSRRLEPYCRAGL